MSSKPSRNVQFFSSLEIFTSICLAGSVLLTFCASGALGERSLTHLKSFFVHSFSQFFAFFSKIAQPSSNYIKNTIILKIHTILNEIEGFFLNNIPRNPGQLGKTADTFADFFCRLCISLKYEFLFSKVISREFQDRITEVGENSDAL